jgi:carbon-monoxide dehydrogenase small subunit
MTEETFEVTLRVNGVARTARMPARRLLHDALRHDLGLTGTHAGCEHGVCGCCTVLYDGRPVRSCLMFAVSAQAGEIRTVEGLAGPGGELSPVQRAFTECHGLQCGFCTPGFLMTTTALLAEHPSPSDAEIEQSMAGNLCRCTGYQNITASVRRAAQLLAGEPDVGFPLPSPEDPPDAAEAGEAAPPRLEGYPQVPDHTPVGGVPGMREEGR